MSSSQRALPQRFFPVSPHFFPLLHPINLDLASPLPLTISPCPFATCTPPPFPPGRLVTDDLANLANLALSALQVKPNFDIDSREEGMW